MAGSTAVVVRVDPPCVDIDDVEDFLATDDLFVEYFNTYLALPSFPEPLCFNAESGGFEVVTGARQELAEKIKAALRSQRRRPRIYRVARQHAYVSIPLIPIIPPEGPEKMEIDTSFNVTTLNKEQGIHWVKAERLPTFLQSECYFEYRLAHVLAQVRLTDKQGHFVVSKIDYTPRPKKKKKEDEEVKVDLKQVYMKQMYVCMGDTSTTTTDTWFSQAKEAHLTEATYVSLSRPVSASRPLSSSRPTSSAASTRPASACVRPSRARPDSGISSLGGPVKSSVFSSSYFGSFDSMPLDDVNGDHPSVTPGSDVTKPITPRPSEPVCVTSDGNADEPLCHIVYAEPKEESIDRDSESGVGDVSEMDNHHDHDHLDSPTTDLHHDPHQHQQHHQHHDTSPSDIVRVCLSSGKQTGETVTAERESSREIGEMTLNDLSGLVVGVVLKKVAVDLNHVESSVFDSDPRFASFFPQNEKYGHISFDMLDDLYAIMMDAPLAAEETKTTTTTTQENEPMIDNEQDKENKDDTTKKTTKGKADDKESDVDSLLDSEEDYEEDDVQFFRRHKRQRSYDLVTKKGIQQFKLFLSGTPGENLWFLWIDIDRLQLVSSEEDQIQYLSGMREKYHKQGAPFEISSELKDSLGLREPGHWTVKKLQSVQSRVAAPLVSYWAPRFLLKELLKTNPARYRQYQEQKLNLMPSPEVYPHPRTMSLLPLRPKSCHPRIQRHAVTVEDMWKETTQHKEEALKELTSPPVGMKRVHGPPAIKPPASPRPPVVASTPRSSSVPPRPPSAPSPHRESVPLARKKPKELLRAHLKAHDQQTRAQERTGSAFSQSQDKPPSGRSRPQSAKPPSGRPFSHTRPNSTVSIASDTWEKDSNASLERSGTRLSSATSGESSRSRSRPKTAPPRPERKSSTCSSSSSSSTLFEGGRRMEALLQALYHEKDSGHFFRAFLKKSNDKKWLDTAEFWEELQDYRKLFYQNSMDPFVVKKHAQAIYSKYIVTGSPKNIGCSVSVRRDVFRRLQPPQEELFDQVEEEALRTLYSAWMAGLSADMHTYDKVELQEVKRHLETKNQFVLKLQRSGLIKERPLTPDEPMEGYEDPVYDPALWDSVPEDFKDYTLDKLVHNRLELEHFKQFLAEKYADMDLKCWMDIEAWRRIAPTDERKRDQKAKDIKKAYLNKKYFFGPNSPAGKEGQNKVMQAGGGWGKLLDDRPPNPVLLEAQKYVRSRLEQKWLPVFLMTEAFAERQRPKASMDDVVDDVMVQKRRRSQATYKMLMDNKWTLSSKEILTFRRALMNPVTSHQFRRYVSIKGENLENNVLFWQEVQKYKHMHHVHTEDSLLAQKISAIIHCFIDSPMPPSLQLDLPSEMAERVLDRKHEKCPYLFREAQMAVFRILFSHWNDFCEFRSNLAQDKVMPTIERRRRRARAQERLKQQEMEKKSDDERRESTAGLTPGGPDTLFHDPFADHESQEDETASQNQKGRIEFSYSAYISELTKDEVVHNSEDSMLSSLADLSGGSSKDLSQTNANSAIQINTPTTDRKQSVDVTESGSRKHSRQEQAQSHVTAHIRRKNSRSSKRESITLERLPSAAAGLTVA